MWGRRTDTPSVDLRALPPEVRKAVEAAIDGHEVRVRRGDRDLGSLVFRPAVLEGVVVDPPRLPLPEVEVPEGVQVVATAMKLSAAARRRMADAFGDGYLVLDLHEAPASTDVVLVNPVSPQLVGELQARFPRSRVVVTEIEDEELGVAYSGPVGRFLAAGVSAYLPPQPVDAVVTGVRAHVEGRSSAALDGRAPARPELPPRG